MKAQANAGGGNFALPQPGMTVGRCVKVIQLGTQDTTYAGVAKKAVKMKLVFELPLQLHTFKNGEEEKPFHVTKEYTLSINTKANFRKDIESWRGGPLKPEEETGGFDPVVLLGRTAQLNVAIDTKEKDGRTNSYPIIKSISPLLKEVKDRNGNIVQHKQTCPPLIGELIHFDFEVPETFKNFAGLYSKDQEKIRKAPEFQAIKNNPAFNVAAQGKPAAVAVADAEESDGF